MATFLFTARNHLGSQVTERMDATNLSAARYKLELNGYTEIRFHTDELGADIDRTLRDDQHAPPAEILSPKQQLDARRTGGVAVTIWSAWNKNAVLWVPLFIWTAFAIYHGAPFRISDWAAFSLTAVFVLYFIWMVLPGVGYQKILEAGLWFRWPEMKRWISLMRTLKKIGYVPIPDFELDFRQAWGMAAEGRLADAIVLVEKHQNGRMGPYAYWTRLGSIYEAAGDYDKMIECRRLGVQHGTGKPAEKLDLAIGLLRRKHETAEASRILEEAQEVEGGDLVKIFLLYAQGLLALEERRWDAAAERFRAAVQHAKPYQANIPMSGLMSFAKGYLAIALANLGVYEEARVFLREAEPILTAQRETELLGRCKAALPRS